MTTTEHKAQQHVTADPLTDASTDLVTEVRVLKEIIRALLPDRHALGRIEGRLIAGESSALLYSVTVTMPLDPSDDELGARVLAKALRSELQAIADKHAEALSRACDVVEARRDERDAVVTETVALVSAWCAREDVEASDLVRRLLTLAGKQNDAG